MNSNVVNMDDVRMARIMEEMNRGLTEEQIRQRNAQWAIDWSEPGDNFDN